MARTDVSGLRRAGRRVGQIDGYRGATSLSSSTPSMPGMSWSEMTTCTMCSRRMVSASGPLSALKQAAPDRSMTCWSESRASGSSSTRSTARCFSILVPPVLAGGIAVGGPAGKGWNYEGFWRRGAAGVCDLDAVSRSWTLRLGLVVDDDGDGVVDVDGVVDGDGDGDVAGCDCRT